MKIKDGNNLVDQVNPAVMAREVEQRIRTAAVSREPGNSAEKSGAGVNLDKIRRAADALNQAVDVAQPNRLKFHVDDGAELVQVQVINQEDGKVIKSIPADEILDLMARIKEMVGWFLDERA